MITGSKIKLRSLILLASCSHLLSGCYLYDFFSKDQKHDSSQVGSNLGAPIGAKAGSIDESALETVYATSAGIPPAAIRPDPDMYARWALRQYRTEGSTIARAIGSLEGYRVLLGGASQDFQKKPQTNYDATSLLSNLKVAEQICYGLIAPDSRNHDDWDSILPADPSQWESNIRYLAQRFLGKPSSEIDAEVITDLKAILDAYNDNGVLDLTDYIPVCTTLSLDAEALLL